MLVRGVRAMIFTHVTSEAYNVDTEIPGLKPIFFTNPSHRIDPASFSTDVATRISLFTHFGSSALHLVLNL